MIRRAFEIINRQGLLKFLALIILTVFRVGINVIKAQYYRNEYVVYELELEKLLLKKEEHLTPDFPEMVQKIIINERETIDLQKAGYDVTVFNRKQIKRLKAGAIAFCLYSGKDLVHIGWVCLDKRAQSCITQPYKVDFKTSGCIEGSVTMPRYLNVNRERSLRSYKGPFAYVYFKRAQYIKALGYKYALSSVMNTNISARRIVERFDAKVIGRGRYTKLLWFEFWNTLEADKKGLLKN